jgi:hypothetical protein
MLHNILMYVTESEVLNMVVEHCGGSESEHGGGSTGVPEWQLR